MVDNFSLPHYRPLGRSELRSSSAGAPLMPSRGGFCSLSPASWLFVSPVLSLRPPEFPGVFYFSANITWADGGESRLMTHTLISRYPAWGERSFAREMCAKDAYFGQECRGFSESLPVLCLQRVLYCFHRLGVPGEACSSSGEGW